MAVSGCFGCVMAIFDKIGLDVVLARKRAFDKKDNEVVLNEESFRSIVDIRSGGRLLLN